MGNRRVGHLAGSKDGLLMPYFRTNPSEAGFFSTKACKMGAGFFRSIAYRQRIDALC